MRDNLATLLPEASELGRGLRQYVERDFAKYPKPSDRCFGSGYIPAN
ncbi:hypothetical protein [Archangium sp.]|nr:hypothetical protein [Archangium sp.]HYO51686.1 hypothetical protein [Archangium sp.]